MSSLCGVGNDIGAEGAVAMGPHLGKLVNIRTLNLACTRCYDLRWALLVDLTCCDMCEAGNCIDAEGAVAMGPHLGKLVNMHTLNLERTYGLCSWL